MNTMQLLCNGQALDLYENVAVQFTQDNPLFAFDNIKCERTTQLKIPATPTNDVVLSLARVPATSGEGMRRRFDAVMRFGIVEKRGYLYVSQFDGTDYEAIFVTGEYVVLQKAKEAGKIKDIITPTDKTEWGNPQAASSSRSTTWKCVKYLQERTPAPICIPSMRIYTILQNCAGALGLTISVPSSVQYLRIIPSELRVYSESSTFASKPHTPAVDIMNEMVSMNRFFEPCTMYLNTPVGDVFEWQDPQGVQNPEKRVNFNRLATIGNVQGVRAKMDILLTFGTDAQYFAIYTGARYVSDIYGVSLAYLNTQTPEGVSDDCAAMQGNAGYFHTNGVVLPDPSEEYAAQYLITEGTEFFIIDTRDIAAGFTYAEIQAAAVGDSFSAFKFEHAGTSYIVGGQPEYAIRVDAQTKTPEEGENVLLYPNLPDITFVDLLKTIAYILGRLLYFDGTLISYIDFDFNATPLDISDNVINIKEIDRGFNNWGQSNIISFEHDESVLDAEKLETIYKIKNENLKEGGEIGKIYASEGSALGGALYMRNEYKDIARDTICNATAIDENLMRVTIKQNNALIRLCAASTQIQVQARMSIIEYNAINPKTVLYLNGNRYVWTSSQWQNDVAKLTLAKII